MKIISRFRDYYDSAMAHGQDQTVQYLRQTVPLGGKMKEQFIDGIPKRFERFGKKWTVHLHPKAVYFCGKLHPCVDAHFFGNGLVIPPPTMTLYSYYDTVQLLHSYGVDIEADRRRWYWGKPPHVHLEEFMKRVGEEKLRQTMIDARLSIVLAHRVVGEWEVLSDPFLKPHEFFKAMPPYVAFQELSMWVGGVLPAANAETVNISDKDRILQRGFDKWSFRKLPGGKKK